MEALNCRHGIFMTGDDDLNHAEQNSYQQFPVNPVLPVVNDFLVFFVCLVFFVVSCI